MRPLISSAAITTGPLRPTVDVLRPLQVAHLLTAPFENLSIHTHERIVLDDEALFDKIVALRRGVVSLLTLSSLSPAALETQALNR